MVLDDNSELRGSMRLESNDSMLHRIIFMMREHYIVHDLMTDLKVTVGKK